MSNEYILVLQGSFNPVTVGHVNSILAADAYLKQAGYNIVKRMIVPTSDKYEYKDLESDAHRLEMIRRSIVGTGIEVSTVETDKDKWIDSAQTVKELDEMYPDQKILYLCGSDKVFDVHKYDKFNRYLDELVSHCQIVVIDRRGYDYTDEMLEDLNITEHTIKVPVGVANVSSTFVRDNIHNITQLKGVVHQDVVKYIKENSLYH